MSGKQQQSLNSFADHAPKTEWFEAFFALENNFFTEHSLGPNQFSVFGFSSIATSVFEVEVDGETGDFAAGLAFMASVSTFLGGTLSFQS